MRIQCSWCKASMGEKKPLRDVSITHSVCSTCIKKIDEKLGKG